MDGEKLLAHVENLVPGFVTLAVLASRIPESTQLASNVTVIAVVQQPFIAGVIVTAIAYMLGTLTFVLSRWSVDTASALSFRPLLLKLYRWTDFKSANPADINRRYRATLDEALKADNAVRQEVSRRRERARLVRTPLVPLMLWVWPWTGFVSIVLLFMAIVAVYAYAEVAIYQEARLAS